MALISNNKKSGRIPVASFVCRGTVTRTLDPLVPNQMRIGKDCKVMPFFEIRKTFLKKSVIFERKYSKSIV